MNGRAKVKPGEELVVARFEVNLLPVTHSIADGWEMDAPKAGQRSLLEVDRIGVAEVFIRNLLVQR